MIPLPDRTYSIVYADPPWAYKGRKQFDFGGDVVHQYPTLSTKELCALDVPSICEDDALLFMWVTSPLLPDGLKVMAAWGFEYATVAFVWDKQRINPGYYTLSQCELCIAGKRGKIPQPRGSLNERQFLSTLRGAHSAKPKEVRRRIQRMFPTHDRIELFARECPLGWDAWGNEVLCEYSSD
jgi:N6-adenosine-specific RNA methylase IME4